MQNLISDNCSGQFSAQVEAYVGDTDQQRMLLTYDNLHGNYHGPDTYRATVNTLSLDLPGAGQGDLAGSGEQAR